MEPPVAREAFWQETEDWHTAGEPFRIVSKLPAKSLSEGLSVAEQRLNILRTPNHPLDLLRQSLCHEPRGHADMYGGYITPPDDSGAHFGVLFWHRDGFSTACGHGTIALGHWAVAKGLVEAPCDGNVDIVIDVPSGRVVARATCSNYIVQHIDFVNVTSYQISKQVPAVVDTVSGSVELKLDLSYSGAVYACVNVAELGLRVEPKHYQLFISLQHQIKAQMADFLHLGRYDIYGVCFFEDIDETPDAVTQRNVVVFADGQIDRSPCGSGTGARIAVLMAEGKMSLSKRLIHESILRTTFEGFIENTQLEPGPTQFPACIPRIRGNARLVGRCNFYIDPSDPVYPGFLFR